MATQPDPLPNPIPSWVRRIFWLPNDKPKVDHPTSSLHGQQVTILKTGAYVQQTNGKKRWIENDWLA